MKPIKNIFKAALTVALLVFASVGVAEAQTNATQNVNLNYNVPETVVLTVSPASVDFTAGSGNTATASPISVSIAYSAATSRNGVGYVAYLPNAYALKGTSTATQIPNSDLFAWNSGTSGTPTFDQTTAKACTSSLSGSGLGGFTPPAGQNCDFTFWEFPNGGGNNPLQGTLTDTLNLSLQGLPALPVDQYAGELVIYAGLQ